MDLKGKKTQIERGRLSRTLDRRSHTSDSQMFGLMFEDAPVVEQLFF